jgi:NAD(P)-dependent dehydrogenase (short-subunit alcohol dehydrogenase family)
MGKLEGRVAMVTGANRGIGRAVAEGLAGEGARVAVCARDVAHGEEVASMLGNLAFAVALDVTSDASCTSAVLTVANRCGGLHVLVNNAGIGLDNGFQTANLPLERFDRTWATNVRGPFVLIQLALRTCRPPAGGAS